MSNSESADSDEKNKREHAKLVNAFLLVNIGLADKGQTLNYDKTLESLEKFSQRG